MKYLEILLLSLFILSTGCNQSIKKDYSHKNTHITSAGVTLTYNFYASTPHWIKNNNDHPVQVQSIHYGAYGSEVTEWVKKVNSKDSITVGNCSTKGFYIYEEGGVLVGFLRRKFD